MRSATSAPATTSCSTTADGDTSSSAATRPRRARSTCSSRPSTSRSSPTTRASPTWRSRIGAHRRAAPAARSTRRWRSPTAATFEERCSANNLAVGRVRSARDLADSDWAAERGAIAEVSDRGGGTIRIPNAPWHFSERRGRRPRQAKYRGEDNRAVLADAARLRRRHLDGLEADGVLSSRVPSTAIDAVTPFPVAADEGDAGPRCPPTTTAGPTRSSGTATARSCSSTAARCGCRARLDTT